MITLADIQRTIALAILLCPICALADLTNAAASWSGQVFVSICGDSIPGGFNEYHTINDGGPSGDTAYSLAHRIYAHSAVKCTNYAKPNVTWSHIDGTQVAQALTNTPKYVFVHCGVNDVATSVPWLTALGFINSIYSKCVASNAVLIVDEIFPDSNFNDTQSAEIRQWNTNYSTWVSTNAYARLFQSWADMGQTRGSTGQKDDLATAYNSGDGVHLSSTGIDYWAQLIVSDLSVLEVDVTNRVRALIRGNAILNGKYIFQ